MPENLVILIILLCLPLVPTFWAIVDIPKRKFPSSNKKLLWMGIVSTLPFFGAMVYILFVRRHTQPL